jgi:methyl coenzyme M reductase gamma subunit
MPSPSKVVAVSVLSVTLCLALSTLAFAIEKEVYDKAHLQQPGRMIHGKVVKVVERDVATHKWDVSVENGETGEVVPLHLDKTTARKETDKNPAVGDKVIVKYDENSMHALSFVADSLTSN